MNKIPREGEFCYEVGMDRWTRKCALGVRCPCIDRHTFLWCYYYDESLLGFAKRLQACIQEHPQIITTGKEEEDGNKKT